MDLAAPINTLPTELMLQIFLYFQPMSTQTLEISIVHGLASICRHWRSIILTTPEFWTYVSLCESDYTSSQVDEPSLESTFDTFLWRLERHLSRTGDLPLTVRWHTDGLSEPHMLQFSNFFQRMPSLNRWKCLEVGPRVQLPRDLDQEFTSLEDLTFEGGVNYRIVAHIIKTPQKVRRIRAAFEGRLDIFLHRFSMLSTLSLGNRTLYYYPIPDTVVDIHLCNLTAGLLLPNHLARLTLVSAHATIVKKFNLQNLKHFECMCFFQDAEVVMPALRTLVMSGWRQEIISLKCITAPKLENLVLRGLGGCHCGKHDNRIEDRIELHTEGHQLTPTSLDLGLNLRPRDLVRVVGSMPSVEHLSIALSARDRQYSDELARALVESTEQSNDQEAVRYSICPKLVALVLCLNWAQSDTEFWRQFASYIFRGRSRSGLKYVRCDWRDGNAVTVEG